MSNLYKVGNLVEDYLKGITPKYVEDSSIIVLNQKCIRNNTIDYSFAQFHSSEKQVNESKKLRIGDILINSTGQGTAGRCAFVKDLPPDVSVITDSHILILRISDFYLAGCLEYSLYHMEKTLQTFMSGSTGQGEFDKEILFNIVLPLPDKCINTYKILDLIDRKIENNKKIINLITEYIQSTYRSWFIEYNFPESLNVGYVKVYEERLGKLIPMDWKVGEAKEIFEFNPKLSIKKTQEALNLDMEAIPIKGFMTKKPLPKAYNGGVKFQFNDVVIARITPCLENGKTALITRLEKDQIGFGSTEFIVMRGRNIAIPYFTACFARSEIFRNYAITNLVGTSGRKRVDHKVLESFVMPIPPEDLLMKFEKLAKTFFVQMTNFTVENEKLISLRSWLLPLLMSDQLSIRDAEDHIAKILEQNG